MCKSLEKKCIVWAKFGNLNVEARVHRTWVQLAALCEMVITLCCVECDSDKGRIWRK